MIKVERGDKLNILLIGNGINIQYGRGEISNKDIILRAIDNVKSRKINTEIVIDEPDLLLSFFGICYKEVSKILEGKYKNIYMTSDEKLAYDKFLDDYSGSKSLRITDIGFEDYFFIMQLIFRKYNIQNPEAYIVRGTIERFFIDSIYNEGKINQIYKDYPEGLKNYFDKFDMIFTTNYDKNIEYFTNRKVYYLHGAFHIRDDVYNPDSLRNHLSDAPLNDIEVNGDYPHLYSNAITTYSGNNKLFKIMQGKLANEAIEKFVYGYAKDNKIRIDIDSFRDTDNQILINLYESVLKKLENSDLSFSENYPIKEFENIEGEISIVGLAPNNDIHIFEMINNNPKVNKALYYYYTPNRNDEVKDMFNNKEVEFFPVKELWKMYE